MLDNAWSYPVYDDIGEYISFIEHWTDAYTAITYWDVYYPNYVEHWNNEDGVEHLVSTERSVGLPIHYHNFNDEDYNFGLSMHVDIKPIMDDLEDIMSKLGDAIYVNTLIFAIEVLLPNTLGILATSFKNCFMLSRYNLMVL